MNHVLNALLTPDQTELGLRLFLDVAVKGSAILLIAIMSAYAWRSASASCRHSILAIGLASLLALPVLSVLLPAWQIAIVDSPAGSTAVAAESFASSSELAHQAGPASVSWMHWVIFVWGVAAGVRAIAQLGRLRLLRLGLPHVNADMPQLASLKHLETLILNGTDLDDAGLAAVGSIKTLKKLEIVKTRVTSTGLQHLKQLENLKSLSLAYTAVDDTGIEAIASLRGLEELDVFATRITENSLASIGRMRSLRTLNLPPLMYDDDTLASLAGLKELRSLQTVMSTHLTAKAMMTITGLPHLESLKLHQHVDDSELHQLAEAPALKRLEISSQGGEMTAAGLMALQRLPELRELTIVHGDAVKGLAFLDGCQELESLKLLSPMYREEYVISDDDLAQLSHVNNLRHLSLPVNKGARITTRGWRVLGELDKLEHLFITGNGDSGITDENLNDLSQLKHLKALRIASCPQVTSKGVAELRKLPALQHLMLCNARCSQAQITHLQRPRCLSEE